MKKCYNFLMVLMTVVLCLGMNFASAQEILLQEDFSTLTGSGTSNTQCEAASGTVTNQMDSLLPGWTGDWVYPANGKAKIGKSGVAGYLRTPSIDLTQYETVRVAFQAMVWNANADNSTMMVYVETETDTTDYQVEGLPTTVAANCQPADFTIMIEGGREVTIRFVGHYRIFLDNIVVTPATAPLIEVQGTTTFNNVPVNQEISGNLTVYGYNLTAGGSTTVAITGDSQFATTATTLNNDDLMGEDGANVPFTFTAAEAGTYTATLSFTNSDLTEAVTVTLTANVIAVNEIATIAELRELIDCSNHDDTLTYPSFYKYTGHAYITQAFTDNKTKWMEDETGAIQLYDPDIKLSNVSQGVEITNVVGKLVNYFGYAEFKVMTGIASVDINAFPTTIPEPLTITLDQLLDQTYMDGIQARLVRIENVTFNETGTFDRYGFYTVTHDGTTDTAVYVTSNANNIKGQDIPTEAKDVIGVNMRTAAYSAGYGSDRLPSRYYVLPRELSPVTGISENGTTPVSVYPNPTADNVILTIGGEATTVSVYNVMGTLVSTQSVSYGANTVNMSSMPAGVYFLRITNGNEAVGTVKVVRQ